MILAQVPCGNFPQSVGSARFGAVTHPGAKEKRSFSDI